MEPETDILIRLAQPQDLETLGLMTVRFWVNEELYRHGIGINNLNVIQTLRALLENGQGVIVVAEKEGILIGFIAGVITPWCANYQQRIVQELIWWVNPEDRGTRAAYQMMNKYEEEARNQGCHFSIMGTHDAPNEERLIQFYESCGFRHLQYQMIKEI